MAGYNYLALGASEDAMACFETVTKARPDDLYAWEGLRSAAEALGDVEQQATACTELGELCNDDKKGALYWEKAALFALDSLEDEARGELALERAFARDPERKVAFDRLFRRVRQRSESDKLLSLITRRLEVASEPDEIAKLFWERARVLRQKGDRDGAVTALENVTMIEPDHVGALALKGEIEITQSNFAEAASCLSRLALLDAAPAAAAAHVGRRGRRSLREQAQRHAEGARGAGGAAHGGLSTMPVRERMARAAAKAASWDHATSILEELMNERATKEGRIEAARLAMAIWRDKLKEPVRAAKAITKLLEESPEDSEALDLVLEANFPPPLKKTLLQRGRTAVVEALADDPVDRERVARLTKIAKVLSDWPLRQATLGALAALAGRRRHDRARARHPRCQRGAAAPGRRRRRDGRHDRRSRRSRRRPPALRGAGRGALGGPRAFARGARRHQEAQGRPPIRHAAAQRNRRMGGCARTRRVRRLHRRQRADTACKAWRVKSLPSSWAPASARLSRRKGGRPSCASSSRCAAVSR